MNETFTCPICGKEHRRNAKYCPTTGRLINPTNQQDPSVTRSSPFTANATGGLTGRLDQNKIINNRFRILNNIGKGGMAAVYQAADIRLTGKIWAVKEMSENWITDPAEKIQAVHAFQQEALILAKLDHPNLPKVIDVFSEAEKHYLVMEFIHGQTLEKMLEDRSIPFTETEMMPWALQLCDVLHYLHTQPKPIIFRDLKPSNIMIDNNGRVKLIDFGIVRFFKPGQAKDTMAFGTQGYCAMEALSGQTDARSDLYSLCVVLHEILTKHNPATTLFRLPPIRQLNPNVSPECEQIIRRGLEVDRNLRWPDLKSFSEALSRFIKSEEATLRVPATLVVPVAEAQKTIQSDDRSQVRTSRPTTRLVVAMTRLSTKQLTVAIGVAIVITVMGLWLFSPILVNYPLIWNNLPIIALVAPLVFTAVPRRWLASITHFCFSIIGGATIYYRLSMIETYLARLLLGAVLSSAFIELWLRNLDRVRGPKGEEAWKRELTWLVAMAVIASALLYQITFGRGLNPVLWLGALIMSSVGWFLGDMIKQYLKMRQLN